MNKIIIILAVLGLAGCAALQNAHEINMIVTQVRADINEGKLDEAEQLCVDGQRRYPDGYDWASARSAISQYRGALVKYKAQKVQSLAAKDMYHVVGCGLIKESDSSDDISFREPGDKIRTAMAKKLQKCSVDEAFIICDRWRSITCDYQRWSEIFYDGKKHEWEKTVSDEDVDKKSAEEAARIEKTARMYYPFFLFCEAYSKIPDQIQMLSFIDRFMSRDRYMAICREFEGRNLPIMRRMFRDGLSSLSAANQDGLMLISTNNLYIGSPVVEAAYNVLSSNNQFKVAKIVAEQKIPFIHAANTTDASGTLECWYDYSFEKRVLKDWRKELVAEYGCEKSAYPKDSILLMFSSLLYSDEELAAYRAGVVKARGKFDGLFGRKFGEIVDVSSAGTVYGFGIQFWRLKFEPAKKSTAFQDYYLWMTLASHKVFAVEARSKKCAPEGFLELLEKRYMLKFVKSGDIAEMVFPAEKCSLKVFGLTSGFDRTGVAMLSAMFAGALFGESGANEVLGEYCEDEEKRKRQRKSYQFGQGGDDFDSLIVAEDVSLFAMAKKETEELRERQRKEAEQKKKKEAEDAASAF